MSKLLINEPPLVLQKTLAVKLGLNEAIMLQQIHYWASMKKNLKDGYYWVYNSYEDWSEQFPFFSKSTIGRVLRNLEKSGVIIVGNYNKLSFDKTKWYRIDYNAVKALEDEGSDDGFISPLPMIPEWNDDDTKLTPSMTSKLTNNTLDYPKITTEIKDIVEPTAQQHDIQGIINYLNNKANKKFKANTQTTKSLIQARLKDYTLQDIKYVIDNKTAEWIDTDMAKYLRPSTLFNATKFENYINEPPYQPKQNNDVFAAENIMQMAMQERNEEYAKERSLTNDSDDTNLLPF